MPKSSKQSLCFSFCYQICPIHDFKTEGHKQKKKNKFCSLPTFPSFLGFLYKTEWTYVTTYSQ